MHSNAGSGHLAQGGHGGGVQDTARIVRLIKALEGRVGEMEVALEGVKGLLYELKASAGVN